MKCTSTAWSAKRLSRRIYSPRATRSDSWTILPSSLAASTLSSCKSSIPENCWGSNVKVRHLVITYLTALAVTQSISALPRELHKCQGAYSYYHKAASVFFLFQGSNLVQSQCSALILEPQLRCRKVLVVQSEDVKLLLNKQLFLHSFSLSATFT